MLRTLCYYFLLFLMYAILGWIVEVINAYIQKKKFVNRGFLIGPYCPIYGVGMLAIISLLQEYTGNYIVLFILSMTICMVLEYLTSYFMELIFKARCWDYSNKRFNINGRICLETAIPFGLGGMLIMYVINPIFVGFLNRLSDNTLLILGISLMTIFVIDLIVSFFVVIKFRNMSDKVYKDDTELMKKRVAKYLSKYSILINRLINSFPTMRVKVEGFKEKLLSKKK